MLDLAQKVPGPVIVADSILGYLGSGRLKAASDRGTDVQVCLGVNSRLCRDVKDGSRGIASQKGAQSPQIALTLRSSY